MCLIFLSINNHPTYKLIVAANRDEFYERKTLPAHFWEDHPTILGGRDMEANGTWMAMSKHGKISMVTNYRDPHHINPMAPSRGKLVSDFLLNGEKPNEYLNQIEKRGKAYNGFNLVVGTPDELYYLSNYKHGIERVPNGLHGLSNHLLNTPWPKIERGAEKMRKILASTEVNPTELFEIMYDTQLSPDEKLPQTGVGLERERMLSSMFIKSPNYGTRCSTVILVDHDNNVSFSERVYDLASFEYRSNDFQFSIESFNN